MLSPSDTVIVFVLALLLFGPEQLPKIARQLGEVMRHVQTTTHSFMQEMERAAEPAAVDPFSPPPPPPPLVADETEPVAVAAVPSVSEEDNAAIGEADEDQEPV